VHLLERVELEGNNVTLPVPDDLKRDASHHIDAAVVDLQKGDDPMGVMNQTRCEHPDKEMPQKNVTLPGSTGASSYTAGYLN